MSGSMLIILPANLKLKADRADYPTSYPGLKDK